MPACPNFFRTSRSCVSVSGAVRHFFISSGGVPRFGSM
jgi:hypothetical protein